MFKGSVILDSGIFVNMIHQNYLEIKQITSDKVYPHFNGKVLDETMIPSNFSIGNNHNLEVTTLSGFGVIDKGENHSEFNYNLLNVDLSKTKIKYISSDCFNKQKLLESVKLSPQTVIIDSSAFSECTNLKEVTNMDNVYFINDGAFSGCNQLLSLNIPSTL